jgi:hypothetical protein
MTETAGLNIGLDNRIGLLRFKSGVFHVLDFGHWNLFRISDFGIFPP